jgi:hypothetical protein
MAHSAAACGVCAQFWRPRCVKKNQVSGSLGGDGGRRVPSTTACLGGVDTCASIAQQVEPTCQPVMVRDAIKPCPQAGQLYVAVCNNRF